MRVIKNERLRTVLRYVLPFVLMPGVIALGMIFLEAKYHGIVTVAVLLLSLLLFLCGFDRRMVGVRRQVIVAVMVALSRLFLLVHYPSDVLAGAVLGSAFGVLAAFIVEKVSKKLDFRP